MSLFAHRGCNTRIGKRRLPVGERAASRRKLDTFAEAVANGASLSAAGRLVGVSQQMASKMFAKIREELGWQAQ